LGDFFIGWVAPGVARQASLQADSKLDAETVGGTNLIPHSTF
jgi:hypothetical protein